jgi:L,D-transpeptidase ErfK/SrfK
MTGDLARSALGRGIGGGICIADGSGMTSLGCRYRLLASACVAVLAGSAIFAGGPEVITGSVTSHVVLQGETLRSIAARRGTDAETIAFDNHIDLRAPLAVGQTLQVDSRHIVPERIPPETLTINVPQRMLFFEHAGAVSALPVAVGKRGWPTPIASFRVVAREVDPTWDVPPSIQEEARRAGRTLPGKVAPGPNNPLGRYWLALSLANIGIHGTNAPSSIYGAVTHGCIRLHPDDIAALFPQVGLETPGRIIYEPVLLAIAGGEVLLEVHPDVYRRLPVDAGIVARQLAAARGLTGRIDWNAADLVVRLHHGVARPVTRH